MRTFAMCRFIQARPAGGMGWRTAVTDRVAASLVRLPLYYGIGTGRDHVIKALTRCLVG